MDDVMKLLKGMGLNIMFQQKVYLILLKSLTASTSPQIIGMGDK